MLGYLFREQPFMSNVWRYCQCLAVSLKSLTGNIGIHQVSSR